MHPGLTVWTGCAVPLAITSFTKVIDMDLYTVELVFSKEYAISDIKEALIKDVYSKDFWKLVAKRTGADIDTVKEVLTNFTQGRREFLVVSYGSLVSLLSLNERAGKTKAGKLFDLSFIRPVSNDIDTFGVIYLEGKGVGYAVGIDSGHKMISEAIRLGPELFSKKEKLWHKEAISTLFDASPRLLLLLGTAVDNQVVFKVPKGMSALEYFCVNTELNDNTHMVFNYHDCWTIRRMAEVEGISLEEAYSNVSDGEHDW